MYGAILGDIIGSPYEFDRGNKTKDFPLFDKRCKFTDDSVMTVAVGEALMDSMGKGEAEHKAALVSSMQKWGEMFPYAGYGGMFREWLATANPQPYGSFGNGSAMRVSAAGWLYDTLEETREKARWTAEMTHNHPEGVKGAESVAAAMFLARTGHSKDEIKKYIVSEFGYDLSRTCDAIRPGYHHVESCQETVPEAITAFLEGKDFEDAIRNAVSLGGDCDTLTCIAGSMAEAFYGVPEELKEECRKRITPEMKEVLDRFDKARVDKGTVLPSTSEANDSYGECGNVEKEKLIEELLEMPCLVVDFLPEQVPEKDARQYFAVEKYYLEPERYAGFREKFTDILVKLSCYYAFSVCEATVGKLFDNPAPEWLAGKIREKKDLCVLLPEEKVLITLNRDDLYMSVYNAGGKVLGIIRKLAEANGLFVW